eukprot:6463839-Amphidinium_carterae.1
MTAVLCDCHTGSCSNGSFRTSILRNRTINAMNMTDVMQRMPMQLSRCMLPLVLKRLWQKAEDSLVCTPPWLLLLKAADTRKCAPGR